MNNLIQMEDMKILEKMIEILNYYEQELLLYENFQEFFDEQEILNFILNENNNEIDFVMKYF
jgi:lipopolysaccharide biosynthesis glycosyltransferase